MNWPLKQSKRLKFNKKNSIINKNYDNFLFDEIYDDVVLKCLIGKILSQKQSEIDYVNDYLAIQNSNS